MTAAAWALAGLMWASPGPESGRPAEIADTLRIFFVHAAKRELALSDEQTLALLPLTERLEELRREGAAERRRLLARLAELGREEGAKEAAVRAAIDALDAHDERRRARELEVRDEMLGLLEPRQRARFIVFIERFRQAMEKRLRERERDEAPGVRPGTRRPAHR